MTDKRIAGPIAGAFLGSFYGPTGLAIGWTIGSYATAETTNTIVQNTLADLRIQTATYGTPIKEVFGRQIVAGTIIWSVPRELVTNTTEVSKNNEVTTTTYLGTFAIGICEGPIKGISRVWKDGTLDVDALNASSPSTIPNLPGELYLGTTTQLPDATIESYEGAGEVPAFRNTAYMVFNQFNLGADGRIPNWEFEVWREL